LNAERKDELQGKWILNEAIRQGQQTRLMNGFYLNFKKDTLQMNLPKKQMIIYNVDKDTIEIPDHLFQKLTVLEITDSNLIVQTNISGNQFWMRLEKQTDID
jgi:hypothetical protein